MNFYQALKQIELGESVRRLSWDDPEVYCDLVDGILSIHNMINELDTWTISIGDILGDDWVMYGEVEE